MYWRDNPPAHVILAAVHLEKKKKSRNAAQGVSEADLVAAGLLKINRPKRNV